MHSSAAVAVDGLPRVARDADPSVLAALLARDGGLVIEALVDDSVVDRLNSDLAPHVARRRPGFSVEHDSGFYGANTVRIQGLAAKSRTFVDEYLLNPLLLGIADRVLLPECGDYWMSQAETIFIGPGDEAQALHRDDLNWSVAARLRIPLQVSVLLAVGDYDAEVGATMVVPGSHRWPLDLPVDPAAARPVELAAGDALVYLGSLLHGAGHNRTEDRWRQAIYLSYLVGWLTPEEAVPIGLGPDVARTLPKRARELLGFANLPGRADTDDPAEAALQLWQLDAGDLSRLDGSFHHR